MKNLLIALAIVGVLFSCKSTDDVVDTSCTGDCTAECTDCPEAGTCGSDAKCGMEAGKDCCGECTEPCGEKAAADCSGSCGDGGACDTACSEKAACGEQKVCPVTGKVMK